MNIGVVCEGPSDYPAVVNFLGDALRRREIRTDFSALFPDRDNTRPEGGWANVILWLLSNPPDSRVARYFSAGLFGGGLSSPPLDAIVIQIDSDVATDKRFHSFVSSKLGISIAGVTTPRGREQAMTRVVEAAAKLSDLATSDRERHIVLVAVESTESWCVSAFSARPIPVEDLSSEELTTQFMKALEVSEGRTAQDHYRNIDKNPDRREGFCRTHQGGSERVERDCPPFSIAVQKLIRLAA